MSESLVETFFLGELGIATTAACFWARWYLHRKEPGWFVGEHIQVIFTGVEDLFEASVEAGSRLSGDKERLDDGPSVTVGLLPTFVWRDRGLRTALRSLEAFMTTKQAPAKQSRCKYQNLLHILLSHPAKIKYYPHYTKIFSLTKHRVHDWMRTGQETASESTNRVQQIRTVSHTLCYTIQYDWAIRHAPSRKRHGYYAKTPTHSDYIHTKYCCHGSMTPRNCEHLRETTDNQKNCANSPNQRYTPLNPSEQISKGWVRWNNLRISKRKARWKRRDEQERDPGTGGRRKEHQSE